MSESRNDNTNSNTRHGARPHNKRYKNKKRSPSRSHGNRSSSSGNSQRKRTKPMSAEMVLRKYDNLLEQHIIARKKYYEMYNRANSKQLQKLEQLFNQSLENLRSYESRLRDWQVELLRNSKTELYPLDLTFTQNHHIEDIPGQIEPYEVDIHLTETQLKRSDYKNDTEESLGSFEDYLKYKNMA